jgi:class 3 adenylate cyclase
MPQPLWVEAAVTLPFPPEQLWPYVADTDRMDRTVGLPAATFRRRPLAEGGEGVTGEYRLWGRPFMRWTERPFEWQRPHRYSVVREYDLGPLRRYWGGAELVASAGGTRVRVFSSFTPRHPLLGPLVWAGLAAPAIRRARRQYQALGAYLAGRAPDSFPTLAAARTPADLGRLDGLIRRLEDDGTPAALADRLRRLLAEAADEDVIGMRPLDLARRWGAEPRPTLEMFLRAAVHGLLEMHWELLCPGCRGVKATAARLRELAATGHCPACNLPVTANVDESIEARFYPAPAVRPAQVGAYCVGGPMTTPHRIAQAELAPGEIRAWRLDLAPGAYRLRSPQAGGALNLTVESGAEADRLAARLEPTRIAPERARVAAGPVQVELENAGATRAAVALDDSRWLEGGATPGQLMLLPAFRALFSAEALAPGVELAIGRVGLLFTDVAGSTALHERAGDARAFRLVGEHFALMRDVIERGGGAIVKTIGDAVMAAFPDGAAALAAGLAIQRALRDFDTGGLADPTTMVRVGVNAGACFAVTQNERLDYFGLAVILASRAVREARGGEVVATVAALEDARAAGLDLPPTAPFEAALRGIDAPVSLHRLLGDAGAVTGPAAAST